MPFCPAFVIALVQAEPERQDRCMNLPPSAPGIDRPGMCTDILGGGSSSGKKGTSHNNLFKKCKTKSEI